MKGLWCRLVMTTCALVLGAMTDVRSVPLQEATTAVQLNDRYSGGNWTAYGRTYGEQHFSPLREINSDSVARLKLAWWLDLPSANSATQPLEIDGVLYFASGLSVVHALDGASGKVLWTYDPKVYEVAGARMRQGWGSRGIGYWNGKIYTGTADGRLLAVDARTGKPAWTVSTVEAGDLRYITGAPRVFDGKVIIGNSGNDSASIRGYVTTYDAETGKQLWRFYTVPGNPANGFEDRAQAFAAKTWSGEWWKYGGGGAVWNAITYDAEADTILIGTGNGAPWNRRVRSAGRGDNLFICSIVALDARTGQYRWHYQLNPGDEWDFDASLDMHLTDLSIAGRSRKVLITASKNGFLYVIDRTNGKLISAEKIAKVTWATRIDVKSGRPVEAPGARYPSGSTFVVWPNGAGAHSWMPSSYSPQTGLVYVPVNQMGNAISDKGISADNWQRAPGNAYDLAVNLDVVQDPEEGTSYLLAWNPVTQQQAWRVTTPNVWNGGLLSTAGNLVFQGQIDQKLNAYAADDGRLVWSYPAQAAVVAAPITYSIHGRQYLTVISGMGASGAIQGKVLARSIDYRSQARRVLTFELDGTAALPPAHIVPVQAANDPDFAPDEALAAAGAQVFGRHCIACHGIGAFSAGAAPDLRASTVPQSARAFAGVVREGALRANGMPAFEELTDSQLAGLRQYLRTAAAGMRAEQQQSQAANGHRDDASRRTL